MINISKNGHLKISDGKESTKGINLTSLDFNLNEFEIYIDGLPIPLRFTPVEVSTEVTWKHGEKKVFNVNNEYMRSLGAMYLATVKCGIDLEMLKNKNVCGLLRYHIALTFQLMYQNPDILKQELTEKDIKIILNSISLNINWDEEKLKADFPPGNWIIQDGVVRIDEHYLKYVWYYSNEKDYLGIIRYRGRGITKFGVLKISDSLLTLMYCILLAQGKTGFPIVSRKNVNGMVELTQQEFRRLLNTRIRSGFISQNVRDVEKAVLLISKKTESWIDIAEGIIRFPNTITLYKLTESGEGGYISSPRIKEEVEFEEKALILNEVVENNKKSTSSSGEEDSDKPFLKEILLASGITLSLITLINVKRYFSSNERTNRRNDRIRKNILSDSTSGKNNEEQP